ncbi:MAG: TraY domain-containing protein [Cryobacterium sp.]|nr:TraY domain-containing protein [Cryobacterium sp.]MBX3090132.1 TraY domain-containing protein [Cryobacterium sp.]
MVHFQLLLTEEVSQLLERESERSGRSKSALVHDAIVSTFGNPPTRKSDIRAIEMAFGSWEGRDFNGKSYVERLRKAE